MRFLVLLVLAVAGLSRTAAGQMTRQDSAAVLLDAARELDRTGRSAAARDLLRLVERRYAGTAAAVEARSLLGALPATQSLGTGRTGFVLFHTVYGGFLGLAVPAALGADGGGPYGAGLLVGAPLGFFASRAFAAQRIETAGQAGAATFAILWGTWQGLGWQQALDIGSERVCDQFGCFTDESDTAPWAAMVLGGVAGIGAGYAIAATTRVANGTSSLVSAASFWGTWFGLALTHALFDIEGDDLLAGTLLAGNAALLAALPASRAWRPSPSRVRLITAAGIAGGLVGVGLDLLGDVEEGRTALAIPAATSAAGLVVGALLTRGRDLDAQAGSPASGALVDIRHGVRLGIPAPLPGAIRLAQPGGGSRLLPVARLMLVSAQF